MTLILQRPWTQTSYNGSGSPTVTSGVRNDTQKDERAALTRTPRAQWRPPTPYFRKVETGFLYCFDTQVQDDYCYVGYPSTLKGYTHYSGSQNCSGYYYAAVPQIPISMENKAIIKARLKLKNVKINLAQNFGERKQTARLIGDTLVRLRRTVLDVKRMNFRRLKKLRTQDGFDLWLELQYGWKPALSDCYGAVAALHQREQEILRPITTVKAVVMEHGFDDLVRNFAVGSTNCSVTRRRRWSHKCVVRLDFTEQDNPVVNKTLVQLGITNPLELAWELLPFSFVADWFLPIGDYLSQLDATIGWDFKGGSCSRITRCEIHPVNPKVLPDSNLYARKSSISANGYGYQVEMDRKVYSTPPLGMLPDVRKLANSSGLHFSNGIALLASAIAGGGRVR